MKTLRVLLSCAALTACASPVVEEEIVWTPEIAPLMSFVEGIYPHQFDHPVEVQILEDGAFDSIVNVAINAPACDGFCQDRVFAEGLMGIGSSGREGQLIGGPEELLGLYQSRSERLYVRGPNLSEPTKAVVVHELTHALQDQIRPKPDVSDESAWSEDRVLAYRTIGEGDAQRVENRYLLTHPDAYQPGSAQDIGDAELLRSARAAFPYVIGARYLQGKDQDDIWANPPKTTLEIIRDRDNETRSSSPAPQPILYSSKEPPNQLGGATWLLSLLRQLEPADAFAVMDNVDFEETRVENKCVLTTFSVNPADAKEVGRLLSQWLGSSGRVNSAGSALDIKFCELPPVREGLGKRVAFALFGDQLKT